MIPLIPPTPPDRRRTRPHRLLARLARVAAAGTLAVVLAACQGVTLEPPTANPAPFPEIAGQLGRFGVDVASWTAGDPGCDDPSLSPTAIRFEATGLDQPSPLQLRIYIFRNREAWTRRAPDVEACAASWAVDPATFELVQISPYVLAGQGPWPPEFKDAIREALVEAAGNGG